MAKGKKISEVSLADALVGDELIPFAKNGANGAVEADTIKEYAQDGLDDKYADKSDTYTKSEVDGLVDGAKSTAETTYAKKEDVPTKVSELENDAKYQDEGHVSAQIKVAINAHEVMMEERLVTIESKVEDLNASKVGKVDGKGLSTNDYTTDDKNKLGALPTNAELTTTLATKADYTAIADMLTKTEASDTYQPKGDYLTSHQSLADYAKTATMNTELAKKVDKVSGKQLSTEDFTTLLKQKLEGLTNYDDSTLTSELDALKSRLDTILDSENTTAVIDTFQEIENFLQGVTNTETLTGLLQEMKEEIVALCADTYVSKTGDEDINGRKTFKESINTNKSVIHKISVAAGFTTGSSYYENDTRIGGIGAFFSWDGTVHTLEYYYMGADHAKPIIKIDADGNAYAKSFTKNGGISSQFLKADGSVDGTTYLPTASYTASDVLDKVKSADGAGSGLDADLLDGAQSTDYFKVGTFANDKSSSELHFGLHFNNTSDSHSQLGYPEGYGVLLNFIKQNEAYGIQIHCSSADKLEYRIKFGGDFHDWKEIATPDSNVASAEKVKQKFLTNEDLNTLRSAKYFEFYSAELNSTCTNVPSGVKGFSLEVLPGANNNQTQILTSNVGEVYKRSYIIGSGGWTPWKKMLTEDDIASLVTRIEALEAQLNG